MNPDRMCCETMESQLTLTCEHHPEPFDCPDVVVVYDPIFDEYTMPIRDGGPSGLSMSFCPWCGTAMPTSQRDEWFDTLESMGFESPTEDDIPIAFKTDAWWRQRK